MWALSTSSACRQSRVWLNISSSSRLNLLLAERVYLAQSTNHICCFDIEKSFKPRSKLNRKASSWGINVCSSLFPMWKFMIIQECDCWMKVELLWFRADARCSQTLSDCYFFIYMCVYKFKIFLSVSLFFSAGRWGQAEVRLPYLPSPFLSFVKDTSEPPHTQVSAALRLLSSTLVPIRSFILITSQKWLT